jgi:lycopene cyclase domain-containing protein
MKYLALNLAVTTVVIIGLVYLRTLRPNSALWTTLAALTVLTAVFDSLIIWSGIVDYNYESTLGVTVWRAPIEDFFYTIVAVIGSVGLWEKYGSN